MSFFQMNHQVDINLYLREATALRHHSRELAAKNHRDALLVPLAFSASLTLKPISFHQKVA